MGWGVRLMGCDDCGQHRCVQWRRLINGSGGFFRVLQMFCDFPLYGGPLRIKHRDLKMIDARVLNWARSLRSEERRVGKEGRGRWWGEALKRQQMSQGVGVVAWSR